MIKAVLISLRPRQWTKNLIIFAGIIFTGNIFDVAKLTLAFSAFVVFCFLSGSIYMFNDLHDVEQDRMHPIKKNRPIVSGELNRSAALVIAVLLIIGAFALALWISPVLVLIAAAYLMLQIAYTLFLKNIVIIDVFAIAGAFVLRALAGTESISVSMSPWLLICTILLALFLALNKRRHEIRILGDGAAKHRMVLAQYSTALLDQMTSVVASATIIAYALYTFTSPTSHKAPYLMLSVPFVIYGVFRYEYLVFHDNQGGSPEEILFKDIPTLVNIGLWGLSLFIVLYTA